MATPSEVLNRRRAGILLHITSLPSTLGLGSLGKHAYRFVDFLKECDLSVWQMLPIHPLHRRPQQDRQLQLNQEVHQVHRVHKHLKKKK